MNVLVVNVTVDSAGDDHNTGVDLLFNEVLGQIHTISEGAGGSNKDQACEAELLADFGGSLTFGGCSQLVGTTTDVVDSSEVQVVLESFPRHLDEIFFHETVNTVDESNQFYR